MLTIVLSFVHISSQNKLFFVEVTALYAHHQSVEARNHPIYSITDLFGEYIGAYKHHTARAIQFHLAH